jgi:hypothetical protein
VGVFDFLSWKEGFLGAVFDTHSFIGSEWGFFAELKKFSWLKSMGKRIYEIRE